MMDSIEITSSDMLHKNLGSLIEKHEIEDLPPLHSYAPKIKEDNLCCKICTISSMICVLGAVFGIGAICGIGIGIGASFLNARHFKIL